MVGNGEQIHNFGFCPGVPLLIQHLFHIPFYLLPIEGADVVLGAQWVQTLGPFLSDFTIPSMQFYHNGILITFQGSNTPIMSPQLFISLIA